MSNLNELVAQFQEKFETPKDTNMWAGLIHEETEELMSAFVNVMKELADLNYVIAGYANVCEQTGVSPSEDIPGNEDTLQKALMSLDIIEFWLRNGIPLPMTIELVHESNMSKLGDDGKPICAPETGLGDDGKPICAPETGKILKGPNYQPPEDKIAQMLFSRPRHELESMLNEVKAQQGDP